MVHKVKNGLKLLSIGVQSVSGDLTNGWIVGNGAGGLLRWH